MEKQKYQCTLCTKKYSQDSSLKHHINSVHLGLKPFKCPHCDTTFVKKSYIKPHVESIHLDVKHTCSQCKKTFASIRTRDNHIARTHNGSKPFACTACNGTFTEKKNLEVHIASVHNGLKPYSCNLCDSSFSQPNGLKEHVDIVHLKLRPHTCEVCKKNFSTKGSLKKHVDAIHLGLKLHICKLCNAKFTHGSSLNVHTDIMHSSYYKHVCENQGCGMLFKIKSNLNSHVNNRHSGKIVKYIKADEERVYKRLHKSNIAFEHNVRIVFCDGVKAARLDFIIQVGNALVILEVDEHGHGNLNLTPDKKSKCNEYSVTCEQSRMTEIVAALKSQGETRPIGFIRYNPHTFKVDGVRCNPVEDERENNLISVLQGWTSVQDLEIQYMYYDAYTVDNKLRCCIWDHEDYNKILLEHCRAPIL